ncbi:hypothetical protein DSECCO2_362990 [anaerobic digester metagenome]
MSVSSQIAVRDAASQKLERIAARYAKLERAARAADTATSTAGVSTAASYDIAGESIRSAGTGVDNFNRQQEDATAQASLLQRAWSGIGGYVKAAAAALGLTKVVGLSDSITGTRARLDLIVDDGGSVAELDKKIYASAMRSRALYTDTAATVSKLGLLAGDAFSGNDEMIAFSELMNKNFVIGGASTQEQSSAMYQLTQAMASGRLQGDEYRSIIENAPLLASAIEDYMKNVQKAKGTMKDWASDGLLTAGVIKAALFSTADEVESRFEKMPLTWAQVGNMAANIGIKALDPLLTAINWLANNISIIGPIVLGVGAAFLVFQVAAHWTQIAAAAAGAYRVVLDILQFGYAALTGQTYVATAATSKFMGTLLASPITWVVMGVMLLVAALYAGVAAYNKLTGSSVSATGIICGAASVMGAFVLNNSIIPMQRGFASFANFVGNVFNDPVAATKILFYDMALTVLGYIQNIVSGIEGLINKIPGMNVDLTSGIDGLYNRVNKASQTVKDQSGWVEYVKTWDYIDYGSAAQAGYDFGEKIKDKISGAFGITSSDIDWDAIQSNIKDIKTNTDEVNIADEDLQFLRDVAEMRYVQNFVTLTPTVAMQASISEKVDVKEVVNQIDKMLTEEIASSAEGVFV